MPQTNYIHATFQLKHRELFCFLSNLFLVLKKDGGMRPVINIKSLTHFVRTEHFKNYGRASSARHLGHTRQLVHNGRLQRCTLQCSNLSRHQKFLSFCLEGNLFQFVCFPFGLAPVPRIVTKAMKPALELCLLILCRNFSHLFHF